MTQEQPFYSEAYTKVIALAKRYAPAFCLLLDFFA